MAIDHVIESLEPHKAREFVALCGIIFRIDPLGVGEHLFHMLDHQAVIVAGGLCFFGLPFGSKSSLGMP